MRDEPVTPEQLQRALAGDRRAIEALVRGLSAVIQARVVGTLLRYGRASRAEVEDMTQEVFVAIFADDRAVLAAWDPERGLSLRNFVGLLAQRRVISLLRSRRQNPLGADLTDPAVLDSASVSGSARAGDERASARDMLQRLALRLQETLSAQGLEMFYRLYVWEQSPDAIALETGVTRDAIYQWRHRLKKAVGDLRRDLEGTGGAEDESGSESGVTQGG